MAGISKLITGYFDFYKKYFVNQKKIFEDLHKNGQAPKTLVVACSDSRVDPSIITNAKPGEIFVIRNVANLVPPFQNDKITYHGTSAALEFAVNNLNVENILIIGHSHCAGIKELLQDREDIDNFSFVKEWVKIAQKAKSKVINNKSCDLESDCAKEALIVSLENLITYPWIKEKIDQDLIDIHAWYFDLQSGHILQASLADKKFRPLK